MIEALAILGVMFVILTIVMLPQLARGKERHEAAFAIVGTIWVIVGFGVGSWAVSWVMWNGIELVYRVCGGGFGCMGAFFAIILLFFIAGLIQNWHRRRRDPNQLP